MEQQTSLPTLSPRQVASILGVHWSTVQRWADAGEIAHFKTPSGRRRFAPEAVEAFRQRRTVTPEVVAEDGAA